MDLFYENEIKISNHIKEANIQLALSVSSIYDLDAHFGEKNAIAELAESIQKSGGQYLAHMRSALDLVSTDSGKEHYLALQALLTRIHSMQLDITAKLQKGEYGDAEALRRDSRKIRDIVDQAYEQSAALDQLMERATRMREKESDALYAGMIRQSLALLAAAALCGLLLGLSIRMDTPEGGTKNAGQTNAAEVLSADEKEWWADVFAQNRKKKPPPKRGKSGYLSDGSGKNEKRPSSHRDTDTLH